MVSLEELLLGKPIFRIRQKGVPPLLLPTSMLQLPRCLVRICNLDSHDTTLFELDSFKNAIAAGKQSCKIQFASQMWAARPHLGSIFKKLLHRKTFCLPAARYLETMLLKKTVFRVRQKGVPPLLLPTSMLQLPRCLVRICNLFHKDNQLRISKFQKMQLQQGKQISKTNLLRKCGLLAHTSAAFLKNCCTEKLFRCLRLVSCNHIISKTTPAKQKVDDIL